MAKRLTLFLILIFCSGPAYSETRLADIIIEGNQRIETETIKSYLKINKGDVINERLIDKSLENIYATGLFSDISVKQDGNSLKITVIENPIINEVAFEGNKRITKDSLEKEVLLKQRSVYNKTDVQNDVKRILDIYHKSGRFSVRVEPKIIKLEQNRVNLVFEINEGDKTEIKGIFFAGNKFFSDGKLQEVIQTKVSRWYRFFSSDDTYDPDRVAYDQELLRRFYMAHGYADFKVLSVAAELNPENNAFFITFSVDEGEKYHFGKMDIQTDFTGMDTSTFLGFLKTKEGDTFNSEQIESSIAEITKQLENQGYAFVDIDPKFNRDAEKKLIGLTYNIKQGPRVYVEKINIKGNVRTKDKVIRREFRLAEGDPYSADKIKRSQQRINNLGFFDKAEIKNSKGSAPDRVNIDVNIEERSTGELTLGAGFSTVDGVLGEVNLTERNILGTGQSIRLNTTLAQRRQEVDLSYTDPYFFDKNIAAGFDIFDIRRNRETESSFDSDSKGITLRASYPVNEHLTHSAKYTLKVDDVTNVTNSASKFIQAEAGITSTSLIGHSLLYDKTDNKLDPTSGYFLRFNQDLAGIGGDERFLRHEFRAGLFFPTISDKWVLKFSGKGGYIFGLNNEKVNLTNRFFLGGTEVRGFANDGIGPHDEATEDALGGNLYYSGSAEFSFPLGLPEELGFSGSVFTDAGTLYKTDLQGTGFSDDSALRLSAGVGFSWSSPLGPVRIDIAQALAKSNFDQTQTLRFSFGTKF